MDRSFMAAGRCVGLDPDLFHPVRGDMLTAAAAKAVCAECPVREACLEYALAAGEHWGIWGGTSAQERRRIRTKRREAGVERPCGRPGCTNTFAPTAEHQVYCGEACKREIKNGKARRQRAA